MARVSAIGLLPLRFGDAASPASAGRHPSRPGSPEHLGQPPGADVPPEIHLPEAVLGMHEALGHEQVVLVLGVDVGDRPCASRKTSTGVCRPGRLTSPERLREGLPDGSRRQRHRGRSGPPGQQDDAGSSAEAAHGLAPGDCVAAMDGDAAASLAPRYQPAAMVLALAFTRPGR